VKKETFEKIAAIVSEISEIEVSQITPEKNAVTDLGVDSLDFLDITYEIDQAFGIKMPVQEWSASDEELTEERIGELFKIENICDFIDYLVDQAQPGS